MWTFASSQPMKRPLCQIFSVGFIMRFLPRWCNYNMWSWNPLRSNRLHSGSIQVAGALQESPVESYDAKTTPTDRYCSPGRHRFRSERDQAGIQPVFQGAGRPARKGSLTTSREGGPGGA